LKKIKHIPTDANKITRKEAIKKMGKYAALTAIGSFIILNPKKAQAASAESDTENGPPNPGGFG
jgi:hypothetical protein